MGEKDTQKLNIRMVIKYISTIISWTIFVLLSIIGILLIYYFISTKLYALKGDKFEPAFSIYTIVSGSMEPTVDVYDVIINTKIKESNKIKINDVITFTSTSTNTAGMTITHRVIGVRNLDDGSLCYVTRGDNNTNEDNSCVASKNVIGKVSAVIPQLGRIQFFLASKFGWLLIIVLPALYIIFKDLLKIIRLTKEKKKEYIIDDDNNEINNPIPEDLKSNKYEEYVSENNNVKKNNKKNNLELKNNLTDNMDLESIDDNYFEQKEIDMVEDKKNDINYEIDQTPFSFYDKDNDETLKLE